MCIKNRLQKRNQNHCQSPRVRPYMEAMEFQDSQAFNGENLLNFTIWGYVRTNGSIFPGSNGKGGGQSDPIS